MQGRMRQTSASWGSPPHCGLDPWQRLRAGVGPPDQLCMSCESVGGVCLFFCHGATSLDTTVTLQSLSCFLLPCETPQLSLGTPLRTSGQFNSTSFSILALYSWIGPPHCPLKLPGVWHPYKTFCTYSKTLVLLWFCSSFVFVDSHIFPHKFCHFYL